MNADADRPLAGWQRFELRVRPASAGLPWCAWLRASDPAAPPRQFDSPFELVRHLQAPGSPAAPAGSLR